MPAVEDPANESYDDYVENVRERMTSAYEEAWQALRKVAERNKRYDDDRVRPNKINKVGRPRLRHWGWASPPVKVEDRKCRPQ